ncbi:hypothetical protein [Nocardia salmonicida]|uniref:hypothetical protein n=1 Tax=Nocardia salmonicida TaxID=53431 RepID=UPI0033C91184
MSDIIAHHAATGRIGNQSPPHLSQLPLRIGDLGMWVEELCEFGVMVSGMASTVGLAGQHRRQTSARIVGTIARLGE